MSSMVKACKKESTCQSVVLHFTRSGTKAKGQNCVGVFFVQWSDLKSAKDDSIGQLIKTYTLANLPKLIMY